MTPRLPQSDRRKLIWPLALAATITWCSGQTVEGLPPTFEGSDKVVHFAIYGLLATLVSRIEAVQRMSSLGIYAAILIVSVFGMTDELHQYYTPGRSMDIWDWVADTTGALLATVLYVKWHGYRWLLEMRILNRQIEISQHARRVVA